MADTAKGAEMTFWDHLDELRGAVFRSVAVLVAFSCLGLIFKDFLFESLILAPAGRDFCIYRLLGWDFGMELINVEISAQFFVHLRASLSVGLVLAMPYIIWEVWKFVLPALYEREKKALRAVFLLASLLFYAGVLTGYFIVLPVCLQFFMNYSVSSEVVNTITLGSYMSMFTSLVLLIGIVFEFPTVVLALAGMGIVDRASLKRGRKYAVLAVLILSALITPSDPFSMLVLAVPLYLLYELSILLCSSRKKVSD